MHQPVVKIAVVGDIHDLWELEDNAALKHLSVDLALFVGDYGNEAVEVVRRIAAVDVPKAAVMGNHDAYYSASKKGLQNCPYDQRKRTGFSFKWTCWERHILALENANFPSLD